MSSVLDLRDRLRPRLPQAKTRTSVPGQAPAAATALTTPAFVVENKDTGKVVLTMPAEVAHVPTADDFLLRLSGRLVEAEKANGNGAFWSQDDLEFGLPSVAYGPLNWLHEERKIVGVLTDARLVTVEQAAQLSPGVGAHVVADATLWRWLYPREAREVAMYSEARSLWYSMECISQEIACVGANGCGTKVPYLDALNRTEKACEHLRERSSFRRFVNPIFQGAAIIVPPTKPGWANADLAVQRQAASYVEDHELVLPGLEQAQAESMVAQVLEWSRA